MASAALYDAINGLYWHSRVADVVDTAVLSAHFLIFCYPNLLVLNSWRLTFLSIVKPTDRQTDVGDCLS